MKVRDVVRLLERDGWAMLPRKATSHMQFKHPTKPGRVTVSDHKGDLPPRELRSIERQSGIELRGKTRMPVRHYRALLEPSDDGSWGLVFPELPGCVSHGDDADQAVRMAAEALALHLEGMAEDGEPIPDAAPLDAPLPDWLAGEDADRLFRVLVAVELPGRARRVNVSLEEGLLQRVDRAARRRGMSRSAFLAEGARRILAEA